MLELLSLSILLCGIFDATSAADNATIASQNATIAREIKLSQKHSSIIVNGSNLITVSTNGTHVQVNSTDESFEHCEIKVDHVLQREIQAKTFGNKIIIWSISSNKSENNSLTRINYTVLIVDPVQCTDKAVSTLEEVLPPYWNVTNLPKIVSGDGCTYKSTPHPEEALPLSWFKTPRHSPQVIFRDQSSFDVFYPSLTSCAPCRFSNGGEKIELQRQIKPEIDQLVLFSLIKAFDCPELEHGYFHATSFRNGTAIIKLLDQNFNAIKERFINHTVDAVAVNIGTQSSINICYMTSRPLPYHSYIFGMTGKSINRIYCERLDDHLDPRFSTELILPDRVEPRDIALNVDSSNSLYVAVQFSNLNRDEIFTVYRMNSKGTFISASRLGEMRGNNYFETWSQRGILIDNAHQYCLEIKRQFTNWYNTTTSDDDGDWLRCIDIR